MFHFCFCFDVFCCWLVGSIPNELKKENQQVTVNFLPNDIAFNCVLEGKEQLIIYMDLIDIQSN